MLGWIRDRINGARHTIDDVFTALHDIATAIWSALTALSQTVRHKFEHMFNVVRVGVGQAAAAILTVYHTIGWIVGTLIPTYVKARVTEVIRWASTLIAEVQQAIKAAVGALTTWAAGEITKARNFLLDKISAVIRDVTSLAARLLAVERLVFALLSDPRKLAVWLAPKLFGPLWQFAHGAAEAIARWLLSHLLRAVLAELPAIERILTDLF